MKVEPQFNRVRISIKDFDETIRYLDAYSRKLSEPVRRALLIAAIIAYGRPWSPSKHSRDAHATDELLGNPKKILDGSGFGVHKRILDLRNKAVAHSSYSRNPTQRLKSVKKSKSTGFIIASQLFDPLSALPENSDILGFRSVAETMKRFCEDKLFELNKMF
jgi:hypothetical protein